MTMTAARPRRVGHPGYGEIHPRESPATGGAARRLVRTALCAWELEEYAEAAASIIAELVANAVQHTSTRFIRISVERPADDRVRLSVIDKEPQRLPEMRSAQIGDVTGRGLALVEVLADRWGYERRGPALSPWGKSCWAELHVKSGGR